MKKNKDKKMSSPTISTSYHAYYSKTQSEQRKFAYTKKDTRKIRGNVWITTDGKEVFASLVCSEKKKKSDMNFPAMVYLGEVTKWVRHELCKIEKKISKLLMLKWDE